MGIRGELFSSRVSCEGRTYFFNVKENRMGDMFLTVVESKPAEGDSFDRRSIVLFRDDIADFLKAFQEALGFMEKPGSAAPPIRFSPRDAGRQRKGGVPAGFAGGKEAGGAKARADGAAEAPAKKRRVVVRRKSGSGGEAPPSGGI